VPNEKYNRAKKLRSDFEKDAKEIIPKLNKIKTELAEYYEIMRFHNLECSREQYEKLYDNCVYPYEENNIDYMIEKLILFMDKNTRDSDF
jgi:hypothetical protein